MDQQAHIRLLNSIMPEIAETRNPEAVLLKCAKAHNLTPAMLEKLGHVFNTTKTLVGLEKMANRGDSFSIVNVPEMVSKYTTYDPSAPLTVEDKKVHQKVEKLTKYAGVIAQWREIINSGMQKAAGANDWIFESPKELPDMGALLREAMNDRGGDLVFQNADEGEWKEIDMGVATPMDVTFDKAASANIERKPMYEVRPIYKEAANALEDAILEGKANIMEKYAALRSYVEWTPSVWTEIAEDAVSVMGKEAAVKAIKDAEEYMEDRLCRVPAFDIEKMAFFPALPRDRHDKVDLLLEADEISKMVKQAEAELAELEETFEGYTKEAAKDSKVRAEVEKRMQSKKDKLNAKEYADEYAKEYARVYAEKSASNAGLLEGIQNPHEKSAVFKVLPEMMTGAKNTWDTVGTVSELMGSSSGARQKKIDKAVQTAARDATLQRLMLTDDIIREADPYEVQDIYHAIADLSPSLANNPVLMSTLIKESLQYGALPIQTIKDIANVEKTITDTEKNNLSIAKDKYSK